MERTSFTTNRSWILGLLTLVIGLAGFQRAQAQNCPAPTGLSSSMITLSSARLSWNPGDNPIDNCWTVAIGGEGMAPEEGCPSIAQTTVFATVCFSGASGWSSNHASVTGVGTPTSSSVSVDVTGLQAGTDYEFVVAQTCDGVSGALNASDCSDDASFSTLDANPTVEAGTITSPSCPFVSSGYVANGSFQVVVTNGSTCTGTYTVSAAAVAGSGPSGSTPPLTTVTSYIGFPAGTFNFANAGAGSYLVTVTTTGGCNHSPVSRTLTVVVPNGTDAIAPTFYVRDLFGVALVDNDNATATVTTSANLGSFLLPEGSCGRQDFFFVIGGDNCDLSLVQNSVTASATTTPNTINPGTQTQVIYDGTGYFVKVSWSVGASTVSITATDLAGNAASLTVSASFADNTAPVVTLLGNSQFTIPVCATSVTGVITVQVDDLCDQSVNFANLSANFGGATGTTNFTGNNYREYFVTFPAAGTYLVSASYTDASGNVGFIDQVVTVQQAAVNTPPAIFASAESATMAACATSITVPYGFTVQDDCEAINTADIAVSVTGPAAVTQGTATNAAAGTNTVYNERTLTFTAAGTYTVAISYGGTSTSATVTVVQSANQPADIVLPGNLTFVIPQCSTSVSPTMSITIVDDCDNPVSAANASFSLGGTAITPSFVNAAAGYFEFTPTLTTAANNGLLRATYTDAQGAVRTVDGLVTVIGQPDTWAPIVVYPTQTVAVNLDACYVGTTATVDFQINATDNCSNATLNVTISGTGTSVASVSGNTYRATLPVNQTGATAASYTVTAVATDAAGNARTVSFPVTIAKAARPVDNLACINSLNVTLGPNCTYTLTPANVLTGNYGCLQPGDFEIVVIDCNPFNGPVIDGCGDFIYEVRLRAGVTGFNFTTCWGNVKAEDKTAPTIAAPANTSNATVVDTVQTITGALGAGDPTAIWANYSCMLEVFPGAVPPQTAYAYDTYTFTVSANDVYTFYMSSGFGPGAMALFEGAFVPGNPCENMIYQGSNTITPSTALLLLAGPSAGFVQQFNPTARVAGTLLPGRTYTLLVTTTNVAAGNYGIAVYSDGSGRLNGTGITAPSGATLSVPLICNDIENIVLTAPETYTTSHTGGLVSISNGLRTKLGYTGFPTVGDNCGDLRVTVSDAVSAAGNCGLVTITRTFRVEDKQGNLAGNACYARCSGTPQFAVATQTITIRKPTSQDIIWPAFTTYLECDQNFPTVTNNNGQVVPSPAVTGYPFLETAFGFVDVNQTYCNLSAQYQDQPVINICQGSYQFVRTWTLLNWCNPAQSRNYAQIIKVGDFNAPVVSCAVLLDAWGQPRNPLIYSTTPFDCTASFAVPMPTVTDGCSSSWSILSEIITTVQVPNVNQYGQPTGTFTPQTVIVKTIPQGANRNVTGIPVGNHSFRYTVTDNCGNVTTIVCPFQVRDQIEPAAICDNQLNISVGGTGFARVYATDINEGSNDNCGPVLIKVRRQPAAGSVAPIAENTPWADFVDFGCGDIATPAAPSRRVRVELRVWDDANRSGVAGDAGDNFSTCWLDVLVEDKVRPFCYAPHPVSIACDQLPGNFNPQDTVQLAQLFNGSNPPSAVDNCSAYVIEQTPIVNLHDCGWGTITRRFIARDQSYMGTPAQNPNPNQSTNTCQQVITIGENHNYWIKFPRDYSANCGDPTIGGIEYDEIGCDLLAVSTTDETLNASGEECYKIFRTYRVINWCEYNGVDAPVVVGREEECDVTTANNAPGYARKSTSGATAGQLITDTRFPDNGIYVIVRGSVVRNAGNQIVTDNRTTWYDSDRDPLNNFPAAFQKNTACDGLSNAAGHWVNSNQKPAIKSRGYWEYTQHIVVYDNVRPSITVPAVSDFCSYDSPTAVDPTCEGPVSFPFSVNEVCTPNDVTIRAYLDAFNDSTFPFDFNVRLNPNGTRSGNTNVFTINGSYPNYTIASTGPQGLPIGTHKFEIQAEDGCGNTQAVTVVFTVKDCKAPTPICYNGLTVTLMPVQGGGGMAEIWATDFIASPIVDCTPPIKYSIRRAGQAPDINRVGLELTCADVPSIVVYIDAWDGAGNRDFCETYLLVQDQQGVCAGPATGSVAGTIRTEDNQPVQGVDVALSGPMSQATATNVSGSYLFSNLVAGGDYTITPLLDANPLNGVSTFDLVLISRHILGVQPLNSPYKMIAADVNNSKSITTLDLIQLRRLILAIDTEFANNTSWRFIPASYVFPVPTNPWFEQFPEVVNVNDLVGNVIDRNFRGVKVGDVNASAIPNLTVVDDRTTNGDFSLNVSNQTVKAGNEYVVTFTGEQMESIRGYQMTLTFDRAKLELVDVVYGAAKEENFGMRYAGEGAITMSWNGEATSDDNLFSLVFRANAEGRLSEMLGVSSRYTRAEAYNAGNNLMGVTLNFGGAVVSEGFELFQNQPNPFKGQTVIGYNLPEASNVTLTVQDATGKVLRVVRTTGVKGYNMETLSSSDLSATGVLYYTIETDGFTATRKMIIVD